MSDEDEPFDVFDPDPYCVFLASSQVESGEAGALLGLYRAVVSAYEKGDYDEVPPEIVLQLMKQMGPPKQTSKKSEQIKLLRHVEAVQLFLDMETEDSVSFREACSQVHRQPVSGSNSYERGWKAKDFDEAYKQLSDLRTRRKPK